MLTPSLSNSVRYEKSELDVHADGMKLTLGLCSEELVSERSVGEGVRWRASTSRTHGPFQVFLR